MKLIIFTLQAACFLILNAHAQSNDNLNAPGNVTSEEPKGQNTRDRNIIIGLSVGVALIIGVIITLLILVVKTSSRTSRNSPKQKLKRRKLGNSPAPSPYLQPGAKLPTSNTKKDKVVDSAYPVSIHSPMPSFATTEF